MIVHVGLHISYLMLSLNFPLYCTLLVFSVVHELHIIFSSSIHVLYTVRFGFILYTIILHYNIMYLELMLNILQYCSCKLYFSI